MPYLPQAMNSIRAQSYKKFEVIVQDGGSTDGSLEFFKEISEALDIKLESEPDVGQGQAYNRAIQRCNGEIIGTVDADNLLEREALDLVASFFQNHPNCAAAYGCSQLISQQGQILSKFEPSTFNIFRLIQGELVPPFSSAFFSVEGCETELCFDELLKSCQDFDLWLRLSHLPILKIPYVLSKVRISEKSKTCNPEMYAHFCEEKLRALERYLTRYGQNILLQRIYEQSSAGIYLWAAESIYALEGQSNRFNEYCEKAAALDPDSERLKRLYRSNSYNMNRTVVEGITPAGAVWNHQQKILDSQERLRALFEAVAHPNNLALYQWVQWFAVALEFKPDLIIELGRSWGNSTCVFTEAANQLENCRVVSLCPTTEWEEVIKPRVAEVISHQWFQHLDARITDIITTDIEELIGDSQRILLLWNASGYKVAEWVLGVVMPLLRERQHLAIVHSISDMRYCGDQGDYQGQRLWECNSNGNERLILGHLNSAAGQLVSLVDFASRNKLVLHSADHSFHMELTDDQIGELQLTLGQEFFSKNGHWFWFSLNEIDDAKPTYFPNYSCEPTTLEKTKTQLQQTQAQLGQSQVQLEQTQAQLGQSQAQLGQSQAQLEQTQAQLGQSQAQLEQTQSQLAQSQTQLAHTKAQLEQVQAEWVRSQSTIAAMENTKFWKLRAQWLRLKRLTGLTKDE
jgi:hypothetical protein